MPVPSPPLPASLFIPPTSVESSRCYAARPTRGHRADYGFINTLDAKTKLQRAEEVGYGIRDVWVDPADAVKENNMSPKRTSVAATRDVAAALRAATAIAAATTPMTSVVVDNCAVENKVKCATYTFIGNALTWWNSHMKTITQDVAYAVDWKTLKKMMTVKYCPRGEIKKLKIELYNLKVKGIDVASYTLRFQNLTLMCGRMFPEESEEVERYVGGLPDMIYGNLMSYQPKTMEKVIECTNDQMDKKVLTISKRKAKKKRKLEFNAGNSQGYQQQNKR
ncbi:putative reverse transcriptase domain-containing protein [Tanacetum coccineum]